ncbi:MAG: tRNA 2-thiouridine(34) synthase MnmA [Elusimicrobia bacterium]|nr:tRNA 2-thiouridine(34) synthase MnmA [Elusimicrobiota bacterium]
MRNIVVAMSGGVDSSVAAALLKEQGHRVIGVTLRLLRQEGGFGCCGSTRDTDDARTVCARLGIPHYVLDFSDVFRERIMDPFEKSYLAGETPNPCIACNRYVKFSALLEKAVALGADAVATGHYARVVREETDRGPRYQLYRSVDRRKDQSYVLHHLGQKELSKIIFPVGEMAKPDVREAARRWGLPVADKRDSQEICFVPGADTAAYLAFRYRETGVEAPALGPGEIRDISGRLLGQHKGAAFYTRGQRHGLNLSVGKPMYVVDVDPATNTVVVGPDEETLSGRFSVKDVHWTLEAPFVEFDAEVKIRSRHEAAPCRVLVREDALDVELREPQRAVTPGQSAVFYDGDRVLGGGTISVFEKPNTARAVSF